MTKSLYLAVAILCAALNGISTGDSSYWNLSSYGEIFQLMKERIAMIDDRNKTTSLACGVHFPLTL